MLSLNPKTTLKHVGLCVPAFCGLCCSWNKAGAALQWYIQNSENRIREPARKNRERHHAEQPVEWLRQSDPSTVIVKAVGQPMRVKQALLQEAIDTAHALVDGEGPVRGGPWANSNIRERSQDEAAHVRRLVAVADSRQDARQLVLDYALPLPEDSYLRQHCLDLTFSSDSQESQQCHFSAKEKANRGAGRPYSGCQKRKYRKLVGDEFEMHKWGANVEENKKRGLARRSPKWS